MYGRSLKRKPRETEQMELKELESRYARSYVNRTRIRLLDHCIQIIQILLVSATKTPSLIRAHYLAQDRRTK